MSDELDNRPPIHAMSSHGPLSALRNDREMVAAAKLDDGLNERAARGNVTR